MTSVASASGFSLSNLHPEWALEILLHEGIPVAQQSGSWSGETALVSSEGREYPVLQLVLAHLAVADRDLRVRHQALQERPD